MDNETEDDDTPEWKGTMLERVPLADGEKLFPGPIVPNPTKKPGPARKLNVKRVEEALRRCHGIKLQAAQMLGVGRTTLHHFINENPELNEVCKQAETQMLDVAESHLYLNLAAGDMKTVRWYMQHKGKDRGYTTRQEVTGADGEPVKFEKIERLIVDPAKQEGER